MSRNFKSECPRALICLPKYPCELGKPKFNNKGNLMNKEKLCPWYINSPEHNYCYWKYMNDTSDDKGQTPSLCYREIGNLLGVSSSTVGITVRKCLDFLKATINIETIKSMLSISESLKSRKTSNDDLLTWLDQNPTDYTK
jgi:hypothetical protein